jgi:hypothetical protein
VRAGDWRQTKPRSGAKQSHARAQNKANGNLERLYGRTFEARTTSEPSRGHGLVGDPWAVVDGRPDPPGPPQAVIRGVDPVAELIHVDRCDSPETPITRMENMHM